MEDPMYSRILIAIDGSEHSYLVAEKGLELAKQLGAKPAIIFVIDKAKITGSPDANITPYDAELLLKKEAEIMFDSIAGSFGRNDFVRFMPVGSPKEDILKISKTWRADIVIVGIHSKPGLVNIILGSIAEYLIHHSTVPTLIIR